MITGCTPPSRLEEIWGDWETTGENLWGEFLAYLMDEYPDFTDLVIRDDNTAQLRVNRRLFLGTLPLQLLGRFNELVELCVPTFAVTQDGEVFDGVQSLAHANEELMLAQEDSIELLDANFRSSVYKHHKGWEMAIRRLPTRIPDPEEIHLPLSVVTEFCKLEHGLVLFSGSTGQGKSTSIASLVHKRAQIRSERIITLESPIDYVYPDYHASVVTQRQVGHHCFGYKTGLKEALRQNPNVIVIQELRDRETMETAIQASLTGHLVVGTLHAGTADAAVQSLASRLLGGGDSRGEQVGMWLEYLATSLRFVVAQKLIARPEIEGSNAGLVPIHEYLRINTAAGHCIRNQQYVQLRQIIEQGSVERMFTFRKSLKERIQSGLLPTEMLY